MASDPLALVRGQVSRHFDEIAAFYDSLSPLDLHTRFDAVRQIAALNGLAALEGLCRHGAQLALLPGHRVALRRCLDHVGDALDSRSGSDCTTILAALAVRLR